VFIFIKNSFLPCGCDYLYFRRFFAGYTLKGKIKNKSPLLRAFIGWQDRSRGGKAVHHFGRQMHSLLGKRCIGNGA
jgi:hypothetical protein